MQGLQKSLHWANWPLIETSKRAQESPKFIGLQHFAIAEHAIKNHEIDWKNAKIVDTEQDYNKRCFLDSWHRMTQKESMNSDLGTWLSLYNSVIPM